MTDTAEPKYVGCYQERPEDGGRVLANDPRETVIHIPTGLPFNPECIADGALIAEAFNIRAETGLTPRQLVEQRDELLSALHAMVGTYTALINSGDAGFWNPEDDAEVIQSRTIIAKVEAKP